MTQIKKNDNLRKLERLLPLFFICAASLLLVLPTIDDNIDDPNRIVYFNHDEGGLMDEIWYYYSGEKRSSYQFDFDYGLEMLYLSDFARVILSRFMSFTPGTFVLILRWAHLIAWICTLIALWRLVSYHFGSGWQPVLAIILLAVRPAFSYFTIIKPEPLVLFFIIMGLDYTLRIIENPSKRNLFIAIAMASLAFIVKFAGLFLLPAIVTSLYFSNKFRSNANRGGIIFQRFKISWILPLLLGLPMIIGPLIMIMFYIRKSTGGTWFEQYGIWNSLLYNKFGLYLFLVGMLLIFLSFVFLIFSKAENFSLKKIMNWMNEINSYAFIVFVIFVSFIILFGFRWIISPKYFIQAYALLGFSAPATRPINMIAEKGFLYSFLHNLIKKIVEFDPILFLLFVFYLSVEIYYRHRNLKFKSSQLFKRLALLIFLIPFLILICSMLRVAQHHMLPFLVAMSILVVQGIYMFNAAFNGKKLFKNCILTLVSILLLIDLLVNGAVVIKTRIYLFHRQHEDIAFDIAKWWRENIPVDARIVAAHYNRVYIPSGYKNVKTLNWDQIGKVEQLRQLVDIYRPEFIYYNETSYDDEPLPPIEEILPGKKIRLIKSFDNSGRRYQKWVGSRFVIYGIVY